MNTHRPTSEQLREGSKLKAQYLIEASRYEDFNSFLHHAWRTHGIKNIFNNSLITLLLSVGYSEKTINEAIHESNERKKSTIHQAR